MIASARSEQAQSMSLLSTLMKVQIVAFLIYGVTFFFLPTWTLENIFAFDQLPPVVWLRMLGALFLAVTLAEYLCVGRLSERLDMVWVFAAIPGLILVGLIWDRVAGIYEGSELFYWVSIAVTVFFFTAIGGSRLKVRS